MSIPAPEAEKPRSIRCPVCGRVSWNAIDIEEGYCGYCHDWTSVGTAERWHPLGEEEAG